MASYVRFQDVFGVSAQEAAELFKKLQNGAGDYNRNVSNSFVICEYCGVATGKRTGVCEYCGAPLKPN